jgi:hypothetical protein
MITPSFGLTATERVLPRLALDFTAANLDSRITFTRALNTATRINSSGYIEVVNADLPRFDYTLNTGGACKGLLIEESRTNLVANSDDLTAYTKVNTTTVKTATGPDNVANSATTLTASAAGGNTFLSITSASAARITSVYVKRRTGTGNVYVTQGQTTGSELVTNGDFSSGTDGWTAGSNATIANVSNQLVITTVANGAANAYTSISTTTGALYKLTFQYVTDNTVGNTFVFVGSGIGSTNSLNYNLGSTVATRTIYFVAAGTTTYITFASSSSGVAGNTNTFDNVSCFEAVGTNMTSASNWTRFVTAAETLTNPTLAIVIGTNVNAIDVYGLQHEVGSFATSLIPTSGATATRNADVATMTGTNFSDWFNATEGTILSMGQLNGLNTATAPRIGLNVSNGSTTERIHNFVSSTTAITSRVISSNTNQAVLVNTVSTLPAAFVKTAVAYKANDFAASSNSSTVATDNSGVVPTLDRAYIGSSEVDGTSSYMNGTVQKIMYWPQRLTNAELQAFTK